MYSKNDLKITIDKKGSRYYQKASYPIRFGRFTEIDTGDYIFCFDRNDRIKIVKPKNRKMHDLNEWLKRTVSNDWIYYSAAGYKGTISFTGEYYFPCFPYSSNFLSDIYVYDKKVVDKALNAFFEFVKMYNNKQMLSLNNPLALAKRAEEFYDITSGRITVLPPDTRHVDYDVIPLNIADGCLYNCGFCSVKTGKKFAVRSKKNILNQIEKLKNFYGADIVNCNSIFLGQHDALNAEPDIILFAATKAYENFGFKNSYMKNPTLFLFGSVDSLLSAEKTLYDSLNSLPFYTYINVGLESLDESVLKMLKKPLSAKKVEKAFERMLNINKKYHSLEVTANFVMGEELGEKHYDSILHMAKKRLGRFYSKGAFYFSPLENRKSIRDERKKFIKLKNEAPISTYLYLIQRL